MLCKFCFSPIDTRTKKCPFCNEKPNIEKFPTSLKEGSVLCGRYAVGKILGKGGFGITYLCYDLKQKRRVAIKEFFPDSLAFRETGRSKVLVNDSTKAETFFNCTQEFFNEAKLISRFNGNPGIIEVYEFFKENNTAYFAMEYLEGLDLKQLILSDRKCISENQALYILDKILNALEIIHSAGVLHRDIKPDNIYLDHIGGVKLIDFGAARQVLGEETKSLDVILTGGFAPLEQYQRRGNQGPWTDIYALGATLYYSLTGKVIDDALSRLDNDALDLSRISPALAPIITKMLAVHPQNRYQNIAELKRDLEELDIPMAHIDIPNPHSYCTNCGKKISFGKELCDECDIDKKTKGFKKWLIPVIAAGVAGIAALVLSLSFCEKTSNNEKPPFNNIITNTEEEKINEEISEEETENTGFVEIPVLSITLSSKNIELYVGDSCAINYTVEPQNADVKKISFTVSDPKVATVDENGMITALAAGKTTITCSASGFSEQLEVEIFEHVECEHKWGELKFEIEHPHKAYTLCDLCGVREDRDTTAESIDCTICNPIHTHTWSASKYESAHPHKEYKTCSCGESSYTGKIGTAKDCTICNPPEHVHAWGEMRFEQSHPHKAYHACACGVTEYVGGETGYNLFCDICVPPIVASGTIGAIDWKLFGNGTLTISGYGAMNNFETSAPWSQTGFATTEVVIENGVTSIGNNAFIYCPNITSITIPSSVTSIGSNAFSGCTKIASITIPANVTSIGKNAFAGWSDRQTIKVVNDNLFNTNPWKSNVEANIVNALT